LNNVSPSEIDNKILELYADIDCGPFESFIIKTFMIKKSISGDAISFEMYEMLETYVAGKDSGWKISVIFRKPLKNGIKSVSSVVYCKSPKHICVAWDRIADLVEESENCKISDFYENTGFEIKVTDLGNFNSAHANLIKFFSIPENCNKLFTNTELNSKIKTDQRGIGGERPREFRYMMGYDFRSNYIDPEIPNGRYVCKYPFPVLTRSERRSPLLEFSGVTEIKANEIIKLLSSKVMPVRCFECGYFEGEINKFGKRTRIEEGHAKSFTRGGTGEKKNFVPLCTQCNKEQFDFYDYAPDGKKIYFPLNVVKKANTRTKTEILAYLLNNLRKDDLMKILKKEKIVR